KRTLEAIADLDAHLAFVRRHDEQRPGILLFLSDLPVTPELVTVVLNRGALERLDRDHDKLPCGLGLEVGELALERCLGRRIENSGIVHHTAGELREGERIGRNYRQEQSEDCTSQHHPRSRKHNWPIRDNSRHPSAPTRQNFTVGGLVTSSATVNVSIGL